MPSYGVSFLPGGANNPTPAPARTGSPMQEAVKILSLKLPQRGAGATPAGPGASPMPSTPPPLGSTPQPPAAVPGAAGGPPSDLVARVLSMMAQRPQAAGAPTSVTSSMNAPGGTGPDSFVSPVPTLSGDHTNTQMPQRPNRPPFQLPAVPASAPVTYGSPQAVPASWGAGVSSAPTPFTGVTNGPGAVNPQIAALLQALGMSQ